MGSEVEFRDDDGKGPDRDVVYPGDADISQARISVLTPVGARARSASAPKIPSPGKHGRRASAIDRPQVREPQLML
jgi:regulator of nucleoside diphosphate kinase